MYLWIEIQSLPSRRPVANTLTKLCSFVHQALVSPSPA
jgi:hypothetical protein